MVKTSVDTKAEAFESAVADVLPHVKMFTKNRHEDLWKLLDWALNYAIENPSFNQEWIGGPIREAYCRENKIDSRNTAKDADYHNFTEWVSKVSYLAFFYRNNIDAYNKWRKSKKGIYHVWTVTKELDKEKKKKRTKRASALNFEEEAKEGVVNADVYAESENMKIEDEEPKTNGVEEPTSWTAPEVRGKSDSSKTWIKEGRMLARNEPSVIVRLLQSLMNKSLLDSALRKTLIGILED